MGKFKYFQITFSRDIFSISGRPSVSRAVVKTKVGQDLLIHNFFFNNSTVLE